LGPPLFTVYLDDLEDEVIEKLLDVLVMKFADDTKGAKVIEGEEDRQKLQQALDCLCDWADRWGMAFNLKKCKIMHIGRHNPQFEYYMRGEKVSTTVEERDIGVAITKNLKPAAQCSKAAGRAMALLHQIRRNFHYRDGFTFVRLYKQYVRPQLEFASQAWSPWLAGDREVLTSAQAHQQWRRRRIVYSSRRTRWSPYKGTRRAAAANGLAAPFARTDIRKYTEGKFY
jgi:ribonuclease P/MRP protein subunit RPP40